MKKILIVDDDNTIVEALAEVLKEEGFDVECITHASAIYEHIEHFHPDVIVLDLLISGEKGDDICKKLKHHPATKLIPIIMISAHPRARLLTEACGADDFLPKPFEVDELLTVLSKHA